MKYQLNIEVIPGLIGYLYQNDWIDDTVKVNASILKGGVSNRVVLLKFDDGISWVLKQALYKLRVEEDWFSAPERIFWEAEAMRWFEKYAPVDAVPKLIFEDQSHYLLAMEAIQPPFINVKTLLLTDDPSNSTCFSSAGKLLGSIQLQASRNPNEIPVLFQDNQFFQTLRIEPYYLETIKAIPETESFLKDLISETFEDQFTLVHGDFSPKNLLMKDNELILLDHEVLHFGDGTFDLGFFICHLLSKANHRPDFRKAFIAGAISFFEAYQSIFGDLGKDREFRVVRHTIACLLARVCGLSQLEYLTSDQRIRQQKVCMEMIQNTPQTINEFTEKINDLFNAKD
ncbi:MAG: aminoglycoside phosphotransferase family protein [Bacteroidetes bacterium]|nr:aminoglycoside phosphotransferase family protein [Bacteroidota bacterium]MDA1120496.1 aminoglycoside phosphotransferase family protein [Bacteroidota bacterium]